MKFKGYSLISSIFWYEDNIGHRKLYERVFKDWGLVERVFSSIAMPETFYSCVFRTSKT